MGGANNSYGRYWRQHRRRANENRIAAAIRPKFVSRAYYYCRIEGSAAVGIVVAGLRELSGQ